jgi:AcrR family transcriptional regulator
VTAVEAPRARRRSRRAEQAILESTIALLGEVGFSGLTVDGIAARAGVGKATIYRHWSSKAQVVIEAWRTFVPPVPQPDTGGLRGDLLAIIGFMVQGLGQSPLLRILPSLIEAAERDPELAALFREFVAGRAAVLRGVLERAAVRGELRPGLDLDLASSILVGPIFARRLVLREPFPPGYAETLVDTLLPALRPAPAIKRDGTGT